MQNPINFFNTSTTASNQINNDNTKQNEQLKYVHDVEIKSTLVGTKSKTIQIQPHNNKFLVYADENEKQKGKAKQYPLNELTFVHEKRQHKGKKDQLHIDTNCGKKYSIKGDNSATIAKNIQKCQQIYQVNQNQFQQQPISMIPKQMNYMAPLLGMNQFQKILLPPNQAIFNHQITLNQQQPTQKSEDFSQCPRRRYYFDPEDWSIDKEKGRVKFINVEKKKNQGKVVKFIIKKFLTTGSFMGISFPTFIMKPESILQSYAKAIGAAPILLQNVTNPVQRMKKFICLIHSFSVIFADMAKPFNPPLGQTFQARIANGYYSAQQVSHHPPISAFLYEKNDYKISGCFQMTASIGPNSATGLFVGDLILQYNDGMIYTGRIPGGEFSGFIIGDHKFETYGGFYAYNNKKLVCSMSTIGKNNFFEGFIGKLKPKFEEEFFKKVKQPQRFQKFSFFDRKCFDTVFSSMQMAYNHKTQFDGKQYFNLNDQKYLPFLPQDIQKPQLLLKYDSRFRKDIPLRAQLRFDESQQEKEKIEEQQRYFRKLREKYRKA